MRFSWWKRPTNSRIGLSDDAADAIIRRNYVSRSGESLGKSLAQAVKNEREWSVQLRAFSWIRSLLLAKIKGATFWDPKADDARWELSVKARVPAEVRDASSLSEPDIDALFALVGGTLRGKDSLLRQEALTTLFLFATDFVDRCTPMVSDLVTIVLRAKGPRVVEDGVEGQMCRSALLILGALGPAAIKGREPLLRLWVDARNIAPLAVSSDPDEGFRTAPWLESGLGIGIAHRYYDGSLRDALKSIDPSVSL